MAEEALQQQRRAAALLDGLQALARGDAAPALGSVDLADTVDAALAAARERAEQFPWTTAVATFLEVHRPALSGQSPAAG